MERKVVFTRFLAVVGTVLVWFPIVTPIVLSAVRLIQVRLFLFDYLIPAELFPAVLLGGGLLYWASRRARSRQRLIGWGLAVTVGLWVGSQVLAVVTGLASGETELASLWGALVIAGIGSYSLAVVTIGVGGIMLLRDLLTLSCVLTLASKRR